MPAADLYMAPERLEGESFEDYKLRRKMMQQPLPEEPAYTTKRRVELKRAKRVLNEKLGARQTRKLQKQARRAAKS